MSPTREEAPAGADPPAFLGSLFVHLRGRCCAVFPCGRPARPAARYATAGEFGNDLEFAIYHKGYGPTIQTIEKYMHSLFPEFYPDVADEETSAREAKQAGKNA